MASITREKIVILGGGQFGPAKGGHFQPTLGGQFKTTWGGQFQPTLGGQFSRHLQLTTQLFALQEITGSSILNLKTLWDLL